MSAVQNTKVIRSSGMCCAVFGCTNNQKKQQLWRISNCTVHVGLLHQDCPCLVPYALHSFPKDEELKKQWITALKRKDFTPGKSAKVCSIHFLGGAPTKENIPKLSLGYEKKVVPVRRKLQRCVLGEVQHSKKRSKHENLGQECVTPVSCLGESASTTDNHQNDISGNTILTEPGQKMPPLLDSTVVEFPPNSEESGCSHVSTQWEDTSLIEHDYAKTGTPIETRSKGTQIQEPCFHFRNLSSKDILFYTGLRKEIFLSLLKILCNHTKHLKFKLEYENQLLLVLIRLRLGSLFYDLGKRFSVSSGLASKIFNSWIIVMGEQLKNLICWLPRETIRSSLPDSFKDSYPKTTCIIDCSEVFLQRPSFLKSRSVTYSSYKNHNTLKFLVAIAPNGYVMFISNCYGGRASDKHIISDCGIFNYILPGDEVMCDRGFEINEELAFRQAKLNIPSFTKNRKQLTEVEVTSTRRIASVRIHVERAIARIKNYRILKMVLPNRNLQKTADAIVVTCAALSNLQPLLIKDKCNT